MPVKKPIRNESGIDQIYYFGGLGPYRVQPGGLVAEAHLKGMSDSQAASLRVIMGTPKPRPSAGRALPSVRRRVAAAGHPGVMVPVGMRNTPESRRAYLKAAPTVYVERIPEGKIRGWASSLFTDDPSGAPRWRLDPAVLSDVSSGEFLSVLPSAMRAVLRGKDVQGLSLEAPPVPAPDPSLRPLVVMATCDAPFWETSAVLGVLSEDSPVLDFVITDDASAPAALDAVVSLLIDHLGEPGWKSPEGSKDGTTLMWELRSGTKVTHLSRPSRVGYLRNANDGASVYDPGRHSFVVFLNGDTDPGAGWLSSLGRALRSGGKVGFAVPLSDNNVGHSVPLPPGCTPDDFSDALLLSHVGDYPEAFCPSAFCLAVRGEVWEKYGPFDAALWGTGYGEETDLECKAGKDGWKAVHAPDSFVRHARSRSFVDNEGHERSRDAIRKIRRAHDPWFSSERLRFTRDDPYDTVRPRAAAVRALPRRMSQDDPRRVAFYTKSTQLCGGTLAMVYLADALRERGWDAHVCTSDPVDADLYDARAGFRVFSGDDDFRRSFRAEVFDRGAVVVGSWVSWDAALGVHMDGEEVVPVLFTQDDERRFDFNRPHGPRIAATLYAVPAGQVVANSSWVARSFAESTGTLEPPIVHVGFDERVFFPRPRGPRAAAAPLRVVAMHRGQSAHRGPSTLLRAVAIAMERANVELTVYGTRPPPQSPPHTFLGKIAHHQVARAVSSSDVLVDASAFQGFGMDAIQAMACGVPVVCFHNHGCAEYAEDGFNALVAEEGSGPEALAERIVMLAQDSDLRERLGRAALQTSEMFTWRRAAAAWEDILLRAIQRGDR